MKKINQSIKSKFNNLIYMKCNILNLTYLGRQAKTTNDYDQFCKLAAFYKVKN